MGKRFLSTASMIVLMGVLLVACGSGDNDEAEPTVTRIASPINAPVVSSETEEEAEGSEAASPEAGSPAAGSPEAAASPESASGESEETAGQTVEVVSIDIAFEPSELTIPADTDVTFVLPNEGAAPHNFSIDELDISVDQAPGESYETVINAPAGTYEFYCNVPGHREAGMVGTLTVE